MKKITQLKSELNKLSSPELAKKAGRFSKTGKGEYAHGLNFLGISNPALRKTAKEYYDLELSHIDKLLKDEYQEVRLIGLIILVEKYKRADEQLKKDIYDFYLAHTNYINNWDLVDLSAYHIVGDYLLDKNRKQLYKMIKSDNMWQRRIAVVSTYTFIRQNDFTDTMQIAEKLLDDEHDLMHKATGWMLREVGKRDQKLLEEFIKNNINRMPRTTLRYAIEKFEEKKRQYYLNL